MCAVGVLDVDVFFFLYIVKSVGKEKIGWSVKKKRQTYTSVAAPSTSTNLAFSKKCLTETKEKISAWKTGASFNKKTALRNKINNTNVTNSNQNM